MALQIDNALEFHKLGSTLAGLGISHYMSAPYSHQQMGHAERRHCHLIDTMIAMCSSCDASKWIMGFRGSCTMLCLQPESHATSRWKVSTGNSIWKIVGISQATCIWHSVLSVFAPIQIKQVGGKIGVVHLRWLFHESRLLYIFFDPVDRRVYFSRDVSFNESNFLLNKNFDSRL